MKNTESHKLFQVYPEVIKNFEKSLHKFNHKKYLNENLIITDRLYHRYKSLLFLTLY